MSPSPGRPARRDALSAWRQRFCCWLPQATAAAYLFRKDLAAILSARQQTP